ncbi:hypothetical protein FOZ61_005113, partial [Perkinsus olseni]
PTVVKLGNSFCRANAIEDQLVDNEILLIGNMPGDVEPARTLRMLYPGMPVKTCLLKEVPTVLELERQLSYLLHSLTALLNDNGEVEDYTIAQACEFAEIDKYSELCATRRAMLRGAAAAGGGQSTTTSTSQRTKPQKQR